MSFDASKYTKSKWLHGTDLPPAGVALTIQSVREHNFDDGTTRPAISFYETKQELSLNKNQTTTMIELFGSNAGAWVNQRIEMIPIPSQFAGKPSIAIRAAAAPAAGAPVQPAAAPPGVGAPGVQFRQPG